MFLFTALYLSLMAWVSLLPVIVTKKYHPPYFWRWGLLLFSSGPLLSALTIAGFFLSAHEGPTYDMFMSTGFFVIFLLIPFQLLVPMTVYLFICSSLKERRAQALSGMGPSSNHSTERLP
jgi:glucose-6-phosphate-specific signal transduction histidine kinase